MDVCLVLCVILWAITRVRKFTTCLAIFSNLKVWVNKIKAQENENDRDGASRRIKIPFK